MATTYDPTHATDKDRARGMLGDTGAAGIYRLQDETIIAELSRTSFHQGLAVLAQMLITLVSQEPDSVDDDGKLKVEWRNRIRSWEGLISRVAGEYINTEPQAQGPIYGISPMAEAAPYLPTTGSTPGIRF